MRILALISFALLIALIFCMTMFLYSKADAHLADRPDLNHWAAGLRSANGMTMCCDGDDAEPIKDVDWDATKEGRYRVRIEGEWVDVPPNAVVPGPNKYGTTLVWGYRSLSGDHNFIVRCFMPGGGS